MKTHGHVACAVPPVVALVALVWLIAPIARAQDWGAMSYSCYHYLTGEPVSCDSDTGSRPVDQTFLPSRPPPPPDQPPKLRAPDPSVAEPSLAQIRANRHARREARKMGMWLAGNVLFRDGRFFDALSNYQAALMLCKRWELANCDGLRFNIEQTGKRLADLARLNDAQNAFADALLALERDDRRAALDLFRRSVLTCRRGGYVCKTSARNARVLEARNAVASAMRAFQQNPALAYSLMNIANELYSGLYFDCPDPETPECKYLLDLWIRTGAFVADQKRALSARFDAAARSRMQGAGLPHSTLGPYGASDRSAASTARLYLELMQLPDDADLGLMLATGPDIENLPKHRDFDLLARPLAYSADRLISDLKTLFEGAWFSATTRKTLTLQTSENAGSITSIIRGEGPAARKGGGTPLTPLKALGRGVVDQIEADAILFATDMASKGATPGKVDYMLAGLHYANVLEGNYRLKGIALDARRKWEVSDLYLRALLIHDPADSAVQEAIDSLGRISRLAVAQ